MVYSLSQLCFEIQILLVFITLLWISYKIGLVNIILKRIAKATLAATAKLDVEIGGFLWSIEGFAVFTGTNQILFFCSFSLTIEIYDCCNVMAKSC
jgi:hypothetical protein